MSKRIYLRNLEVSDGQKMYQGYKNKELTYLTGTEAEFTLVQIESHIKKCQSDASRVDFAICLIDSNEMIGELSIVDIDLENESAAFRIAMLDL